MNAVPSPEPDREAGPLLRIEELHLTFRSRHLRVGAGSPEGWAIEVRNRVLQRLQDRILAEDGALYESDLSIPQIDIDLGALTLPIDWDSIADRICASISAELRARQRPSDVQDANQAPAMAPPATTSQSATKIKRNALDISAPLAKTEPEKISAAHWALQHLAVLSDKAVSLLARAMGREAARVLWISALRGAAHAQALVRSVDAASSASDNAAAVYLLALKARQRRELIDPVRLKEIADDATRDAEAPAVPIAAHGAPPTVEKSIDVNEARSVYPEVSQTRSAAGSSPPDGAPGGKTVIGSSADQAAGPDQRPFGAEQSTRSRPEVTERSGQEAGEAQATVDPDDDILQALRRASQHSGIRLAAKLGADRARAIWERTLPKSDATEALRYAVHQAATRAPKPEAVYLLALKARLQGAAIDLDAISAIVAQGEQEAPTSKASERADSIASDDTRARAALTAELEPAVPEGRSDHPREQPEKTSHPGTAPSEAESNGAEVNTARGATVDPTAQPDDVRSSTPQDHAPKERDASPPIAEPRAGAAPPANEQNADRPGGFARSGDRADAAADPEGRGGPLGPGHRSEKGKPATVENDLSADVTSAAPSLKTKADAGSEPTAPETDRGLAETSPDIGIDDPRLPKASREQSVDTLGDARPFSDPLGVRHDGVAGLGPDNLASQQANRVDRSQREGFSFWAGSQEHD